MYHRAGNELLASQCDVSVLTNFDAESVASAMQGIHAIAVRYPRRCDASVLAHARDVVIVASSGRGTDSIDIAAATARGIVVVNNPGFGAIPVTEQAIAFMLALSRNLIFANQTMRTAAGWQHRTTHDYLQVHERTLGVVGLGAIGTEMTRKCIAAFRMHVLVYDPYVPASKAAALGATMVSTLDEVLERSDVVSMHPELNDETRGMIGEPQLRRMKRTAFLINTARGKVVQQSALVRALTERWIAGAALDVYEDEPPGPGNPLYQCDNLIMSPHIAGLTEEAVYGMSLSAAKQILQALSGKRPPHIVNPEAWEAALARAKSLNFQM
jgi:D-3-phosphoglycerate dehydrogenase/microcystin synthetase protein McyI